MNLSDSRSYYLDLIKLFGRSNDCGNKTALVSSTLAGEKDPNKTVIDTESGAIESTEENFEVSSWHSATHGSRKEPSIANSRPSRRQQIDEMELENLRAKKETKQRLQEQQMELEQKREEIELRRRKEQQERELCLNWQQEEDELRLRQHERELENERKKAEVNEEKRRMEIEWTKESSRASQADDLESVWSRRNLERTAGWANSLAQQADPS